MKFKWREKLGNKDCPYVERWSIETKWFSIRLHKWLGTDDLRNLHDHPWDYWAMVIKGGYTEKLDDSQGEGFIYWMLPWKPVKRKAERRHAVEPFIYPTWSILLTGPERRQWGFWVKGFGVKDRFRKRNKYFFEHGHHPCE